jgi:hypothetical protein
MALDFAKGIATGVVSNNLRRVAGNLPGMLGGREGSAPSSPYKKLERTKSKHSIENLTFPIDVDSDPGLGNHGHYMMFYINQQDHAKLSFGDPAEPKQDGGANVLEDLKNRNSPEHENVVIEPAQYAQTSLAGEQVKVKEAQYGLRANDHSLGRLTINQDYGNTQKVPDIKKQKPVKDYGTINKGVQVADSTNGQNIHVKRAKTTRLNTAIAMYMPANVQVTYGANYTDTEIGSMAERAADTIKAFAEGDIGGGFEKMLNADSDLVKNAGQFLLSGIGNLPGFGGAKELEAMKKGRIISNRMELAFRGINKREFQYTFKMIPRNKIEADEIKKIVHAFKVNMLPAFEGGDLTGRSFIVPNTFDIEYMYNGKQNQFLHKISTCVLESMAVTYGGDRYKTYTATTDGAPPVETTIALNFKEMEMITRERVEDGF